VCEVLAALEQRCAGDAAEAFRLRAGCGAQAGMKLTLIAELPERMHRW
jgi:hypothetical protein